MRHDISQPVPQGSDGAQDAENSRIAAIADELERLCAVHEAQCGDSLQDVSRFETEQRVAEQMAKDHGFPRWERVESGRFSSRKVPTLKGKGADFQCQRCRL